MHLVSSPFRIRFSKDRGSVKYSNCIITDDVFGTPGNSTRFKRVCLDGLATDYINFSKGKLEINIQLTLVITKAKGGRNDFNFSKPMSAGFCASKNEESR